MDSHGEGDIGIELSAVGDTPRKSSVKKAIETVAPLAAKARKSLGGDSIFNKRELDHPTTDTDTLIHLIKGSLGAGILAMPLAFKNAGLTFGLVGTFVIGFICTHCVHALVETAHGLCRQGRVHTLSYGQVAEAAFLQGPPRLRGMGRLAARTVDSFLVVVTLGACAVYLVFIASNLEQVVDSWSGSSFPLRGYIACVVVPLLALCSIRNLKMLSPFSLLSNVLVATSLGIVFYYTFTDIPHTSTKPHFSSVAQLPLFFSTAVFALEGIGVIMPIENNMITPQNFTGNFRVLNTGMTVIVTMYAALGYFGYLKYGDCTEGSVSLNLPDEPLAQSTKLMLALAVCLTYPLQMYVAVAMTWGGLQERLPRLKAQWKGPFQPEHIYRVLLVLFTACIALAVPALDSLMGLIGAVCISTAGLLFPAILETVYRYENLGKFNWIMWKNIVIFLFGALGFVTGVWTSIAGIVSSF